MQNNIDFRDYAVDDSSISDDDHDEDSSVSSFDEDEDFDSPFLFNRQMDALRYGYKPPKKFAFHDARLGMDDWEPTARWTIPQAGEMLEALLINKSVEALNMDLNVCSAPAISVFMDFVQSTPRLQELTVSYICHVLHDNRAIQDQYKTQMCRIIRAALQNPSLKKLTTEGPLVFDAIDAEEGGVAAATSIETLMVRHEIPSKAFYLAMPKILRLIPSLKTLELKLDEHDDPFMIIDVTPADDVFRALADEQSSCAGLEKLVLRHAWLGEINANLANIPPIQNVNESLQVLHLWNITFLSRKSVRVLFTLAGLKKLCVLGPSFADEFDDEDEDYDVDEEEDTDLWAELIRKNWAEFIRNNKNLEELDVVDRHSYGNSAMGVIQGACGHESLQTLRLGGSHFVVDEFSGVQLGQLIRGSITLQSLTFDCRVTVMAEAARPLVDGILENASLQILRFHWCTIQYDFLTLVLECLPVNETLKTFDLCDTTIEGGDTQTICRGISRVFRNSKSLANFHFPSMDINAENMQILVSGLVTSKALKHINLESCTSDREAWDCLEQTMQRDGPNKLSLSSLKLNPDIDGSYTDGTYIVTPFLRSLPRMSSITRVEMWTFLDEDQNQLLLQVAKERKTLLSFKRAPDDDDDDEWRSDPVVVETEFYLKLNRFGRQILDYTNVHTSLWPILLGRMANERKDVDALYFFLREYFANYSGGGNQQRPPSPPPLPPQQRQCGEGLSRPSKIARVD